MSYSDALKVGLLGVPAETIEHHGAVSAQVAVAMADGARARLGCDYAVAVAASPVRRGDRSQAGGIDLRGRCRSPGHRVERHVWDGDRAANKEDSAAAAMELLLALVTDEGR